MDTPDIAAYQQRLEEIRSLIVFGWILFAGGFAALLWGERPDRPAPTRPTQPTTFCALHSRSLDQCEDWHDPEE